MADTRKTKGKSKEDRSKEKKEHHKEDDRSKKNSSSDKEDMKSEQQRSTSLDHTKSELFKVPAAPTPKSGRSSSVSSSAPSRDHPVVKQLLKLEPKKEEDKKDEKGKVEDGEKKKVLPEEEEEREEGEENPEEITFEYLQEKSEYLLIDKGFVKHLSELNPISALHELTQKLGWQMPNMKVAFECGPPMMKMFIFKVNDSITQLFERERFL